MMNISESENVDLKKHISNLINFHGIDAKTDTSDYILAEMIVEFLDNYNKMLRDSLVITEKYYTGVNSRKTPNQI